MINVELASKPIYIAHIIHLSLFVFNYFNIMPTLHHPFRVDKLHLHCIHNPRSSNLMPP